MLYSQRINPSTRLPSGVLGLPDTFLCIAEWTSRTAVRTASTSSIWSLLLRRLALFPTTGMEHLSERKKKGISVLRCNRDGGDGVFQVIFSIKFHLNLSLKAATCVRRRLSPIGRTHSYHLTPFSPPPRKTHREEFGHLIPLPAPVFRESNTSPIVSLVRNASPKKYLPSRFAGTRQ